MAGTLANVSWIGGSPCSGKSTIADRLAAEFGRQVYRRDDAYFRHQEPITPEGQPVFHRLSRATCDELWMRPIPRQVEEEVTLYREEFPFILADLAALPADVPVIAEGAALLPELVAGLGVPPQRAIWIVPSEAFQRAHDARREWRHDVLSACAGSAQAWQNWMARDAGFARFVAADAQARGFRVLTVDGSRSIDDTLGLVRAWFGQPWGEAPSWLDPRTRTGAAGRRG